jgi:hypothetical protein
MQRRISRFGDEREKARLLFAGARGSRYLAFRHERANVIAESVGNQLGLADEHQVVEHERGRRERQADQDEHDGDAQRPAGKENLEERERRLLGG